MSHRLLAAMLILLGLGSGIALAMLKPAHGGHAVEWLSTPRALPDFHLAGQGGSFSHADLHGGWHLLVLGYSHCPDVCPTTLNDAADLVQAVGDGALQVVFVSVDVTRDSPERLAAYAAFFHPTFLGVSTDDEQLSALATALGVRFQRSDRGITHSPTLSLIGPAGQLRGRLRPGYDLDRTSAQLRIALDGRS